jgi:flagellar protein FlaG
MSMSIPTNLNRAATDARAFESRPTREAGGPRASRAPSPPPDDLDIRQSIETLERLITRFNRRFEFRVDERINRVVVKVIDRDTDKLIKEIPPAEIQHLIARLRETMGVLVNEEI